MYGYEIPRYAREYLAEWRRDDRFLRLRWSLDYPGFFILERKTRYLADHPFDYGTDRQVQLKDEYRRVLVFAPSEIKLVKYTLDLADIQKHGGAKAVGQRLTDSDDREAALLDRAMRNEFEAIAGEVYDQLAWAEQRRVAVSGPRVGT